MAALTTSQLGDPTAPCDLTSTTPLATTHLSSAVSVRQTPAAEHPAAGHDYDSLLHLLLRRSFSRAARRDGDHPDAAAPERQRGALHLHQRSLEALPQEGGACRALAGKARCARMQICSSLFLFLRCFIPRTASTTLWCWTSFSNR